MRIIIIIILFGLLQSCNQNKNKTLVALGYKENNILINYDGHKEYIKIPFRPEAQFQENSPAFCLDTLNNIIFIYIPSFGIKKFDLSNKRLIKDSFWELKYHRRNHSFQLRILKDFIVFSSYTRILIFNKNLEIKADLRDTIEANLCPELALHKFDTSFCGDTLLFKALFVEKDEFQRNKRYKHILKDYEFIFKNESIICNNCDRCKAFNKLTKEEIERLLNDPL